MIYWADLNARSSADELPIDVAGDSRGAGWPIDAARIEEIKQAIREEPRRRMDEAPGKRATEQDRHPNAAASAPAQEVEEKQEEEEQSNKKPRLDEGAVAAAVTVAEEETKVAEEDEDSEPSDEEDDD